MLSFEKLQLESKSSSIDFQLLQDEPVFKKDKQNNSQQSRQYQEFFKQLYPTTKQDDKKGLYTKLKRCGFLINQIDHQHNKKKHNHQAHPFQIKAFKRCDNWKIVQLECKLGVFQKNILVFNNSNQSQVHVLKKIEGTMGQIYLFQNQTQNFAVKCIQIQNYPNTQKQNQFHILIAIKQYFLTCIMSALQIGPKIIPFTGFDLIINKNCLQFSIQKCETYKSLSFNLDVANTLKVSLRKMHLLKIVHNDIKPLNIMYSPSFKKIVFIDFGLSDSLEQNFEQQTFTPFKGTPAFCGKQMHACLKKNNYVNLYRNDVICLIQSLQYILKQKKQPLKDQLLQSQNYNEEKGSKKIYDYSQKLFVFILTTLIKFHIIQQRNYSAIQIIQKIKKTQNIIFNKIKQKMSSEVCKFVLQLPYKNSLWQFFNYFFSFQNQNSAKSTLKDMRGPYKASSLSFKYDQNHIETQFQNFFIRLQQKSNEQLIYQSKKVKQILLNKQNIQISLQIYFGLLVNFLSFYNNNFRANLELKNEVSMTFLQNHRTKFIQEIQVANLFVNFKNLIFNSDYFSQQLKTVGQCIKICLAIAYKNIKTQAYRSLFMDLFKEAALLDFNLKQILQHLFSQFIQAQTSFLKKIKNCLQCLFDLQKIDRLKLKKLYLEDKSDQSYQNNLSVKHSLSDCIKKELNLLLNSTLSFSNQIYSKFLGLALKFLEYTTVLVNQQCLQILAYQTLNFFITQKLEVNFTQFQAFTYICANISEYCLNSINQLSQAFYNKINPNMFKLYKYCRSYYQKNFHQFLPSQTKLNNCTIRLNNIVESFDKNINCQEISHTFFIRQRIRMAFSRNVQIHLSEILKFITILCDEKIVFLRNLQVLYNIFWKFSDLTTNNVFKFKVLDQVYQIILKWMFFAVQKITEEFINNKFISIQKKSLQFSTLILIQHAFFTFISGNIQFISKHKECLKKLVSDLTQVFSYDLIKISNKQMLSQLYTMCLLEYHEKISPDYQKQISTIIQLTYNYTSNSFVLLNDVTMTIVKCILYKFRFLQAQEINFRDCLIIYKLLQERPIAVYFQSTDPILILMVQSLLYHQMYDQLVKFFKLLTKFINEYYSQPCINVFVRQISKVYIRRCQCKRCDNIFEKVKKFHHFLVQQLVKKNDLSVWQYCYFSIILIMNLNSFQMEIEHKLIMIKFIAESFKYLSFSAIRFVHQSYYLLNSKIYQQSDSKRHYCLKKFVANSQALFSLQYLKSIYFARIRARKNIKLSINQKKIVQKISQKILKKHQIKKNLKNKNQENLTKQIKNLQTTYDYQLCSHKYKAPEIFVQKGNRIISPQLKEICRQKMEVILQRFEKFLQIEN